MKIGVALLIIALTSISALAQAPTLRIVTETPGLPSDLFYGNVKVKPVRLRPGTNTPITIDDIDFFVQEQYIDFLGRFPDSVGFANWNTTLNGCPNGGFGEFRAEAILLIAFMKSDWVADPSTKSLSPTWRSLVVRSHRLSQTPAKRRSPTLLHCDLSLPLNILG